MTFDIEIVVMGYYILSSIQYSTELAHFISLQNQLLFLVLVNDSSHSQYH
jgi:hypothetical protein